VVTHYILFLNFCFCPLLVMQSPDEFLCQLDDETDFMNQITDIFCKFYNNLGDWKNLKYVKFGTVENFRKY
jgi:hypothetical protein